MHDEQWRRALDFCDLAHLTLPLGRRLHDAAPAWVLSRIDRNIVDNRRRLAKLKAVYKEIANALAAANVEHVILKGFAQYPGFVESAELRLQSDIDLYCPKEGIRKAYGALRDLGYNPDETLEEFPADHLPVMTRRSDWKWSGNFYDPEMPPSVDLHFSLWNKAASRIGLEDIEEFWHRRGICDWGDVSFPALSPLDNLGFNALHVLRDLCRGDWVIHHVYELAWFLQRHATNDALWGDWIRLHSERMRALEAIPIWFAREWFHCDLSPQLRSEIAYLSPFSEQWLKTFSVTPISGMFRPNKVGVWLQVGLIEARKDKLAVMCDTLLPRRLPAVGAPGQNVTKTRRIRRWWPSNAYVRYAFHIMFRSAFHLSRLLPTIYYGIHLTLIDRKSYRSGSSSDRCESCASSCD